MSIMEIPDVPFSFSGRVWTFDLFNLVNRRISGTRQFKS